MRHCLHFHDDVYVCIHTCLHTFIHTIVNKCVPIALFGRYGARRGAHGQKQLGRCGHLLGVQAVPRVYQANQCLRSGAKWRRRCHRSRGMILWLPDCNKYINAHKWNLSAHFYCIINRYRGFVVNIQYIHTYRSLSYEKRSV